MIGVLTVDEARMYTAILLHALESMHTSHIVYRDLKPENIMLSKDGYLKVVDLGMCKKLPFNSLGKTFTLAGTPNYMAPEVMTGKGYSFTADLWSLGIMMFEFLAGYLPYGEYAKDPYDIYE
jgi:cGMP-dependent protein kinase